jgi:hypothetical protein
MKTLRIALFLALLAALFGPGGPRLAAGGPWYVAVTGSDANDCLTPATACRTILHALNNASLGDTIYIAAGTYEEGGLNPQGHALIGAGADVTIIDAGGANRVLSAEGTNYVSGLTLTGGQAASGAGLVNSGTMIVENSVIAGNTAAEWGGGIVNFGNLLLRHSTVVSNAVTGSQTYSGTAGAIYNSNSLVVEASTIRDNTSPFVGGIMSFHLAEIVDSTIHGNRATDTTGYSGGLHNQGVMTITNSTVSGNSAAGSGGAISNPFTAQHLTLINTTVAANTTDALAGGGLQVYTSSVFIQNSLIAGNSPINCAFGGGGTINSLGYNLDDDASCGLGEGTDINNADPQLGPLQHNGGPTQTHALLPGSPAIDKIPPGACPAADQRGFARPQGPACDIGAFEWFEMYNLFLALIRR